MDLTSTYPGGEEAWERDREKLKEWVHLRFKDIVESENPSFWNSIATANSESLVYLQEFHSNFRRLNDWLSMILFMKPNTPKILWMAIINGSKKLSEEAMVSPHTDFPSTPCDPKFPQTDYWNGCRFIFPIDNCDNAERSTQWWDLKDRHKYIIGSREHVNEIRKRTSGFDDNAPDSKYASVIKEEHLDEFELVSVQNLRGPALINTTLPHYVTGSILKGDEPYRLALTLKPSRPDITHCMLMGQTYKGRELYG